MEFFKNNKLKYTWEEIKPIHGLLGVTFLMAGLYLFVFQTTPILVNDISNIEIILEREPQFRKILGAKSTASWCEIYDTKFKNRIKIDGFPYKSIPKEKLQKELHKGDKILIGIPKTQINKLVSKDSRQKPEDIELITLIYNNNVLISLNTIYNITNKEFKVVSFSLIITGLLFLYWQRNKDFPRLFFIKVKAPILILFIFFIIFYIIL